jgi:hypothetical protein
VKLLDEFLGPVDRNMDLSAAVAIPLLSKAEEVWESALGDREAQPGATESAGQYPAQVVVMPALPTTVAAPVLKNVRDALEQLRRDQWLVRPRVLDPVPTEDADIERVALLR